MMKIKTKVQKLPLPGWFLVHDHIVKVQETNDKVKGMEWKTWPMPDEWFEDMKRESQKA